MSSYFWSLYSDAVTFAMNEEDRYWLIQRLRWEHTLKKYGVKWDPTLRF